MTAVIGELLPFAGGVALSPLPIVAIILMLTSQNGQRNATGFLAGWFVGTVSLTVVVMVLVHQLSGGLGHGAAVVGAVLKILFGLFLLAVAWTQWKARPAHGEDPEPPKWLAAIDGYTVGKSFLLGLFLAPINAKNLPVISSAAALIAGSGLPPVQSGIVILIFALLASAGVAFPVLVARIGGDRTEQLLQSWKSWLERYNAIVLAVLFLYLGLTTLGKGLAGVFAG